MNPATDPVYASPTTPSSDATAGPNAGARSVYMADPDGYAVELFQKRPGA
jgi:catechol-2,3-dioxygenase